MGLVRNFLRFLQERQLELASALLHPEVEMIFPGGAKFRSLNELIEWSKPRYRRVTKTIERIDGAMIDDGIMVFCQGMLQGEWPDGDRFENIRFADWFLVCDNLIVRQHVWNDLASAMASRITD